MPSVIATEETKGRFDPTYPPQLVCWLDKMAIRSADCEHVHPNKKKLTITDISQNPDDPDTMSVSILASNATDTRISSVFEGLEKSKLHPVFEWESEGRRKSRLMPSSLAARNPVCDALSLLAVGRGSTEGKEGLVSWKVEMNGEPVSVSDVDAEDAIREDSGWEVFDLHITVEA